MRTLKFRVYIPDQKKFTYFGLDNFTYAERYLHQDKYPVQQFTDLKDQNGVEIYEGDVVKFNTPKGIEHPEWGYLTQDLKQIRYGLDGGQFPDAGFVAISLNPLDLEDGKILNHMHQSYMEVVGNIFENENSNS